MLPSRLGDAPLTGHDDERLLDQKSSEVLDEPSLETVAGRLGEHHVKSGVELNPFFGLVASLQPLDRSPQPTEILRATTFSGKSGPIHLQRDSDLVKILQGVLPQKHRAARS